MHLPLFWRQGVNIIQMTIYAVEKRLQFEYLTALHTIMRVSTKLSIEIVSTML
jgi:hypothetical protein